MDGVHCRSQRIGFDGGEQRGHRCRLRVDVGWTLLPDLGQLRMPTLVMWGANDVVVPVSHAHAAMAILPDADLRVFADCGHMPHIESSQSFVDALKGFLGRLPAG